jgi:hypothetical protein
MKIAVYLVGQWRGVSYQCSENLKKIFDKFDTDYYIHIWPDYEGKIMNHNGHSSDSIPIVECKNYIHTEQDLENIKNSYSPVVSMQIESEKETDFITFRHGTFFQSYCTYNANESRKIHEEKTGTKYDAIIKVRPDIIFGDYAIEVMAKRIEDIKNNPLIIYSQNLTPANNIPTDNYLFWDYYTISSPTAMDCMCQWVKDTIDNDTNTQIFSSNYLLNTNFIINPETHEYVPSGFIMREVFKYNDLINEFYKQINLYENDISKFKLNSIDRYFYHFNLVSEEYDEYFKINDDDISTELNLFRGNYKENHMFLTENGLKRIANLIKNIC